jgi:hypothetical protein
MRGNEKDLRGAGIFLKCLIKSRIQIISDRPNSLLSKDKRMILITGHVILTPEHRERVIALGADPGSSPG